MTPEPQQNIRPYDIMPRICEGDLEGKLPSAERDAGIINPGLLPPETGGNEGIASRSSALPREHSVDFNVLLPSALSHLLVPKPPPLLVLDLDETLIHSSVSNLPGLEMLTSIGDYKVYARPYLRMFLDNIRPLYQLAVWTGASSDYASHVVAAVFADPGSLALVWSRERCGSYRDTVKGEHGWLKDLKKIKRRGFDLARTLIVDDIPGNVQRHYGNHVKIPPFMGDASDQALLNLSRSLVNPELLAEADFRRIDKRGWSYRSSHSGL